MVVHARTVGEVEPGILGFLEIGQPLLARVRAGQVCLQRGLVLRGQHGVADTQLFGELGQAAQLVVRTEQDDVDARHHA